MAAIAACSAIPSSYSDPGGRKWVALLADGRLFLSSVRGKCRPRKPAPRMGIRVASAFAVPRLAGPVEVWWDSADSRDPGPKKRETGRRSRTCHHCQNRSRRKVHSAEAEAALDGRTWSDGQRRLMSGNLKWTRLHFELAHPKKVD
jgi:hypothetical protein